PLVPTSVYETPIASSVYVRGWVRPQKGASTAGTKFHYVQGIVLEIDYEIPEEERKKHTKSISSEPLTQIHLSSYPREWTLDLNLEEGTSSQVRISHALVSLDVYLPFLLCSMVGILLAPLLAVGAIPRSERGWADLFWAGLVGALMGLTVFASAFAFCIWFRVRGRRSEREQSSA